jgi:hypothetical protein
MTERRFTDKEVALILRRASDLEKRAPASAGSPPRGLTLRDLQEIASEAGIDPELVRQAVTEMEGPKGLPSGSLLAGPTPAQREIRATPAEISREAMAELVRLVDGEVHGQGTVQEALGHVRWTSQGRFLSTQVSLEPGDGETLLRVEERFSDAVRGAIHGIPALYGLIFGLAGALEGLDLSLVPAILFAAATTTAGWSLGGVAWRALSAASRKRVRRLAEHLGIRAKELSSPSQSVPSGDPGDAAPRLPEGASKRAVGKTTTTRHERD